MLLELCLINYIDFILDICYNYNGGYDMYRDKVYEKYQWDLDRIYSSITEYKEDIQYVKDNINEISEYENSKIDAKNLFNLLELVMNVSRRIDKLEAYVSLLTDEDTRINKNQEYKEEVSNLANEYIKKTYFVDSNILKLDYKDIEEFYKENEKLKEYEIYLKNMFRYKEYTLSDSEEKLLASLGKAMGNNYDTYELLKDSDLSFPNFLVDGKSYELNGSKYSLYIEDDNRDIRREAFLDLYGVYKQFKNVFGNLISSNVKEENTLANVRGYKDAIHESLYRDELNIDIHDNLVNVIRDKMNILHRYYSLKKKVLGLNELHL